MHRVGEIAQRGVDRLAHPDRGVGGETHTAFRVEQLGGAEQSEHAVHEEIFRIGAGAQPVTARHVLHEPHVAHDELVACFDADHGGVSIGPIIGGGAAIEPGTRRRTGVDERTETAFFRGGEQRAAPRLFHEEGQAGVGHVSQLANGVPSNCCPTMMAGWRCPMPE